MIMLIRIIGVLIFCAGTVVMVKPAVVRRMVGFWLRGKNIYLGAVIRFVLGALFLAAVPAAHSPDIMFILGILTIMGGIAVVILGPARIKPIIERYAGKPDYILRLLSILMLVFALLLVYSA